MHKVNNFEVLNVDRAMHFPVVATLDIQCVRNAEHVSHVNRSTLSSPTKFRWRENQKEHFMSVFTDEYSVGQLALFREVVDINVNDAVTILVSVLQRAAENVNLYTQRETTKGVLSTSLVGYKM